jgi:hypothetical protein
LRNRAAILGHDGRNSARAGRFYTSARVLEDRPILWQAS